MAAPATSAEQQPQPSAEEGSLQTVAAGGTLPCRHAAGRLSAALRAYASTPFLFNVRALKRFKIHFSLNIVSAGFSTPLTKPVEN